MAINEFRVALTVDDFEEAAAFFQNGIGLEPGDSWTDNGTGQMFFAGNAVLEIFDPDYAKNVDKIEAGQRVSGKIRFAFEVKDVQTAIKRALEHGGTLVHSPVTTPWGDENARLMSPDGLQVTLYQPK